MGDSVSQNLANNVRQLREERGVSQQQIARTAGIPRPTWANLESGEANPTLAVLMRAASALGVKMEELLGPPRSSTVYWPAEALPARRQGKITIRTLLDHESAGVTIERMVLQPLSHLNSEPHPPTTFEYLTCEVGELVLEVAGTTHTLLAGDLIAFRCDQAHTYRNVGRSRCTAFSFVSRSAPPGRAASSAGS